MTGPLAALVVQEASAPADTLSAVENVQELLVTEGLGPLLRVVVILLLGFPILLALSRWLRRWMSATGSQQRGMVAGKLFFYTGTAILVVWVLDELGFAITPLLGAAGILGVALGFASQTSVSNIISGFFLMAEQPFVVEDIIQVGTTVGVVESVDMLSVKLRTFDNKFVRIPNESIIKTEVTNITRYPIRRVDVAVGVAYKEDVEKVRRVLLEVADANPIALMEPAPMVLFDGYGESSLNFAFRVWATRENWLELKNTIHEDVKDRFDEEGIEIPFPHRTLYTGAVTEPFPIRIANDDPP
ncbi:MAG: mechanosensitive ion channel family protein, partial [Gemmatimonadota bacterium]